MSKKRRASRNPIRAARRRRKRRQPLDRRGPVQVVSGSDFDPCACPICVDMADKGIPSVTFDEHGAMVEMPRAPRPTMIEVRVRGSLSTWPELLPEARTVTVPVGCVMQDLLEYLRYLDPAVAAGFPPSGLFGFIDGEACDDRQLVRAGDEIEVCGVRDAIWSALAEEMSPIPTA